MKTLPCAVVYMSSLTIMAISADRFRVIVHSEQRQVVPSTTNPLQSQTVQVSPGQAWLLLPLILSLSCALAAPVFINSQLYPLSNFLVSNSSEIVLTGQHDNLDEDIATR